MSASTTGLLPKGGRPVLPEEESRTDGAAARDLFPRARLQTLFRITAALLGLVVVGVVQWRGGWELQQTYNFYPLYLLLAFVFATSIPAALGLRRIRRARALTLLAATQFLVDIGVITVLVHLTGGIDSPFTFLYLLTIVNASAVLFRPGALLTVAASAVAYGTLLTFNYYGWAPPFHPDLLGGEVQSTRDAFYRILVNTLAFLLTGILASYLAEILRRTGEELEERSVDLRELQALTKNIVENMTSGLLTVDRSGRITSFNRAAEEITGKGMVEVLGRPLGDLFPATAERISRRVMESRRFEEELRRDDASTLALGFSYSPLRDDENHEIGTIVIFQDLTELREMENRLKREERLAAVGRLAAGIAHEIRNPLASISGSIEMLKSSSVAPDDTRLMEIILRETDRLDGLITEFLQYVRPIKQRFRRVDLGAVMRETADALAHVESARRVRFVLPDVVPPVRGDRDPLKQVIWNLFLNAAQAMDGTGEVKVTAAGSVLGRRGEVVLVEIADQGPGIPPDAVARVFEPFFTTKERGTGLGLAMVHKIVEAHEGHIEVESEPDRGATFRLLIPAWTAEHDAAAPAVEPERDTSPGGVRAPDEVVGAVSGRRGG